MKKLLFLLITLFLFTNCKKEEYGYYLKIQINPSKSGKVEYSSGPYNGNEQVKLIPVPLEGYKFIGWSGYDRLSVSNLKYPMDENGIIISSELSSDILMWKDMTITANFKKEIFQQGLWIGTYSHNSYTIAFVANGDRNILQPSCNLGNAPNGNRLSLYLYSFPDFDNYLINNIDIVNHSFSVSVGDSNIGKLTINGLFLTYKNCMGIITFEKNGVTEKYDFTANPFMCGITQKSPYWNR